MFAEIVLTIAGTYSTPTIYPSCVPTVGPSNRLSVGQNGQYGQYILKIFNIILEICIEDIFNFSNIKWKV